MLVTNINTVNVINVKYTYEARSDEITKIGLLWQCSLLGHLHFSKLFIQPCPFEYHAHDIYIVSSYHSSGKPGEMEMHSNKDHDDQCCRAFRFHCCYPGQPVERTVELWQSCEGTVLTSITVYTDIRRPRSTTVELAKCAFNSTLVRFPFWI